MKDPEHVDRVRSSLPATQWAVSELSPYDLRHVAEFLMGILTRAPLAGPRVPSTEATVTGWDAERWVIGSLISELRLLANEAGEPEPVAMHFGQDPVGRARALVAEMAQIKLDREAEDARKIGRAEWLARRE